MNKTSLWISPSTLLDMKRRQAIVKIMNSSDNVFSDIKVCEYNVSTYEVFMAHHELNKEYSFVIIGGELNEGSKYSD